MEYLLYKLLCIDSGKYPPKRLLCTPTPTPTPSSGQKHWFAHNRGHPWNGSAV